MLEGEALMTTPMRWWWVVVGSVLLAGCVTGPPLGRLYTDTGRCLEILSDGSRWLNARECQTARVDANGPIQE